MRKAFKDIIEMLEERRKINEVSFEMATWDIDKLVHAQRSGSYECAIEIVNQVAEEYKHDKVYQTAIMYADNIHRYGIAIDSIWETATQNAMALNQAYMRGKQDGLEIFDRWREEHRNDGWIPCEERLPDNTENVLVTTVYGVVLVAYLGTSKKWCYLNGKRIDDSQDTPIAWQPLPQPYVKGE